MLFFFLYFFSSLHNYSVGSAEVILLKQGVRPPYSRQIDLPKGIVWLLGFSL